MSEQEYRQSSPEFDDPSGRHILQAHIRMLDGGCRGCFVDRGRWVPHPCWTAERAALAYGHDMTVRFLWA
jgi:S-methylmethionine-dependent homocysteine/selenocysteine methylase